MNNLIPESRIVPQVAPEPWVDLVEQSAALLEMDGVTTPDYLRAIFASIERNGSYMMVAPQVLLAHARPEEGAVDTGMSLVTTSGDVAFLGDGDKAIRLFFTLAAADSEAHLDLISHLAEVLIDPDAKAELLTSHDAARIREILTPA